MTEREMREDLQTRFPGEEIVTIPTQNPIEIRCITHPADRTKRFYRERISYVRHIHPHKCRLAEEVYHVLDGELELFVGGASHALRAGEACRVSPQESRWARARDGFALVRVSSDPPASDADVLWEGEEYYAE